jgi:anti-anti-sigma factor
MHQSPAFLRVAARSLAGGVTSLKVDLRECAYMDSTFMGSLLTLKREVEAKGAGNEFALVAPSSPCRGLLQQMGMDRVLRIVDTTGGDAAAQPSGDWRELEDADAAAAAAGEHPQAFQETVVRAHQELAEMPGAGAQQFKAIASKLTKAWEAEKGKPAN